MATKAKPAATGRLSLDPDTLTAGEMEELEDRLGPGGFTAWQRKPIKLLIAILVVTKGEDYDELCALSVNELYTKAKSLEADDDQKNAVTSSRG
jgi:hypothetical protein